MYHANLSQMKKHLLTRARLGRLAQKVLAIFHGVWAIPSVLLVRIMRPILLFRIGTIRADRIGHFVTDACEQKARLVDKPKRTVDLFWLPKRTSNVHWSQMVRRELVVLDWIQYVDFWNQVIPGGLAHSRPCTKNPGSRDIEGLYQRYNSTFNFSSAESEQGLAWLKKVGWREGDKFACVMVRDDAYLIEFHGEKTPKESQSRWSYHDYRNSDIETYRPALEWLAEQGVWIFRMGKCMSSEMKSSHAKLIDYPFERDRSEFLDIWLFANCDFCISTSTGPDQLAPIYGRPILYLNASPLGHFTSFYDSSWVPKTAIWEKTGRALTLRESLEHTYFSKQKYTDAGITLCDLSAGEIKEFVEEFWGELQGSSKDSEATMALHSEFWGILREWSGYQQYHGWIHPRARVSSTWLRKQGAEFLC